MNFTRQFSRQTRPFFKTDARVQWLFFSSFIGLYRWFWAWQRMKKISADRCQGEKLNGPWHPSTSNEGVCMKNGWCQRGRFRERTVFGILVSSKKFIRTTFSGTDIRITLRSRNLDLWHHSFSCNHLHSISSCVMGHSDFQLGTSRLRNLSFFVRLENHQFNVVRINFHFD